MKKNEISALITEFAMQHEIFTIYSIGGVFRKKIYIAMTYDTVRTVFGTIANLSHMNLQLALMRIKSELDELESISID